METLLVVSEEEAGEAGLYELHVGIASEDSDFHIPVLQSISIDDSEIDDGNDHGGNGHGH